jgi:hypothetical protein
VISVKIEKPRPREAGVEDDSIASLGAIAATKMAAALALQIKRRVMLRGETVQRFGGYAANTRVAATRVMVAAGTADTLASGVWSRKRFVASRYPVVSSSGRQGVDTGVVVYPDSATMHENVVPGSFNVSGGMWDGLSVVPGREKARIQFRGRSIGQEVPKTEKGRRVYRGRKVSNALKAATVRDKSKVNVLDLVSEEYSAITQAMTSIIEKSAQSTLGATPVKTDLLLSLLAVEIMRAFRRKAPQNKIGSPRK